MKTNTETMMTCPSENEQQRQLDEWDPDKAKVKGTLKAPVDFKADTEEVDIPVDFGEPKEKKIINKKAKQVDIGKRNKNSLF